jgi:DNA-binding PadR family transcriptional regulator
MAAIPKNKALYAAVKAEADAKFMAPTSAYKSGWIVRTYKDRGGKYEPTQNGRTGLARWFAEKWVNLNAPLNGDKNQKIQEYEPCGREHATRKGTYPLCRPSKRVTQATPQTVQELSPATIVKANREKQKRKDAVHVRFGK